MSFHHPAIHQQEQKQPLLDWNTSRAAVTCPLPSRLRAGFLRNSGDVGPGRSTKTSFLLDCLQRLQRFLSRPTRLDPSASFDMLACGMPNRSANLASSYFAVPPKRAASAGWVHTAVLKRPAKCKAHQGRNQVSQELCQRTRARFDETGPGACHATHSCEQ